MFIAALHVAWWYVTRLALILLWVGLAFGIGLLYNELRSSEFQARYLAKLGKELTFKVEPGPSERVRFPRAGPFDERLGYSALPVFSKKLTERDFTVTAQARVSPKLVELADDSLFLPFHEKTQAGLEVTDCRREHLFLARYPERVYSSLEATPKVLPQTLLFIENRELLDPAYPKRNPSVEWDRFGKAIVDQAISFLYPEHETPGGSTLATQIEKYRHSPDGRTSSGKDKLRQMASASVRAYLGGENTVASRRQVVLDYLNTVPLAAQIGHGEVNGLGDGLWAWYGRDFNEVNRLLGANTADLKAPDLAKQAEAYKQAMSLMIAQRRPSDYLGGRNADLNEMANMHLRLLASAGIIPPALRDMGLGVALNLRSEAVAVAPSSFVSRKAATTVRSHLANLLDVARLYDLDRLDLTAQTTLDGALQKSITEVLRSLRDPAAAQAAGLREKQLLEDGDPAKVIYSVTLFERTEHANLLRVQTDNFDQPFDINEGTKLDLGSTAKFRTLVTYLEVIAELYKRLGDKSAEELRKIEVDPRDALTRWAIDYLAATPSQDLTAMLEAAMDRRYSASPGEQFFTGGGLHTFENFHSEDDGKIMPLREGFRHSVNLVFIRLMRDVVRHYMFQTPGSSAKLLTDVADPRRKDYLARFADQEGRVFMRRFYQKYRNKSASEAEDLLVQGVRPTEHKLASIFRSIDPDAGLDSFRAFLAAHLPDDKPGNADAKQLYEKYSPEKFSLADRGYIAGLHPLELWVIGFLRAHPGASEAQVMEASAHERQEVYSWLFSTRRKNAQDRRILNLLEMEGFLEVHHAWQRLGYPFGSLVPSYATALGSSADRPAALAELMGIIANRGIRLPNARVESLHFAQGTPYETRFERKPQAGEHVLPEEVALVARRALISVVEDGTARRLKGAFTDPLQNPIEVGGKTGTGDHRFDTYGPRGQLISSRVVNRSATFMFVLGERFFGTIVAYVPGQEAAKYHFTSALAVQLLKNLAPSLSPMLGEHTNKSCDSH